MGAALKLVRTEEPPTMADLPALLNTDPWQTATAAQRSVADQRSLLLEPYMDRLAAGASVSIVADLIVAQAQADALSVAQQYALADLGGMPSEPTLRRWLSAYKQGGKAALLPAHTGRVRQGYGWEARAIELFNAPSKPGYMAVALRLKGQGFTEVSESRVSRYLKSLPASMGAKSAARVGPHLHKLTRKTYQERSLDELQVGEIYAGDGHCCDCYVAHPLTGKAMRPELTAFIDVKSGYLPGWWFSESESAASTLFALSHAIRADDHVPAWVYVDRGAGYRAKLLSSESTGYYNKMSIGVIGAIAGNPHGKGWVERFFRTVRDRHDKLFAGGQVYCGDDAAPETNRRMVAEVNAGKRVLPSLAQYIHSFKQWLETEYHQTLLEKRGDTPANLWKALVQTKAEIAMDAIARPRTEAIVHRQSVTFGKRRYVHSALAEYDSAKLIVEYDLHDDMHVWLFDAKGRFVVEAELASTIGVLPKSRLEEGRARRLQGQLKRVENDYKEKLARSMGSVDAQSQLSDIASLDAPTQPRVIAGTESLAERRARMQRSAELLDGDVSDVQGKPVHPSSAPADQTPDDDIDLNSFNPDA